MGDLLDKLKSHLRIEEGMDTSMLPFYIANAQRYVQTATGGQDEWLVIMIAGIMYEYRVSEKELGDALDAMTPFIVQGAFANAEDTDK